MHLAFVFYVVKIKEKNRLILSFDLVFEDSLTIKQCSLSFVLPVGNVCIYVDLCIILVIWSLECCLLCLG